MSDLLQTYLRDRDVPCPNCAYNLRDLTTDECPECGLQVVLGVHLAEPKLAAFIIGLIPLAMSAGFSWLFGSLVLVFSGPDDLFLPVVIPGLVSTLLLVVWVRVRPWLRAQREGLLGSLLLLAWIVPVANVFFLASTID